MVQGKALVVGVGNSARSDDGAGPAAVEQLRESGVGGLDVGDAPERYLGPIGDSGAETVVFVDAVDFGGRPGDIVLLEESEVPARSCVTHRSSLGLVMRYLREQGGQRCLLIGVQPGSVDPGRELTPPVRTAAAAVAEALREVLGSPNG